MEGGVKMDNFQEHYSETFARFGLSVNELAASITKIGKLACDVLVPTRLLNEHPADYVLRRGAKSGYTIYPDEAWRFRGNLDWWRGDDTPDQWGTRYR